MLSPDGCCANVGEPACIAAGFMVAFADIWCVSEIIALCVIWYKRFRKVELRYGESPTVLWIRLSQVQIALPSIFISR